MKLLDEIRAYNGTLNFDELHGLVETLNNRINSTCHTATGKIPVLHLEKEKDFLIPSLHFSNKKSLQNHNYKC